MASDSEPTRRKHHRSSSPDDTNEHSKRRKHRHHRHRHRHHRPRGRKVKEEVLADEMEVGGIDKIEVEEGKYGNNGDESGAVSEVMVTNGLEFAGVDYDMEEGEIVEEHGLVDNGNGDFEKSKKNLDSDMESEESKNNHYNNSNLEVNKHGVESVNKNLRKSGKDRVDGKESGEWDRERASNSEVLAKGGYAHKYDKDVHRLLSEDGKRTRKSEYEIEPRSRRKTLSSEKRLGAISRSPSHQRYLKESSHIFKSPEQTRENSRFQSFFCDASVLEEQYYTEIKKQRSDPDDERMISPGRNCRNCSKDDTRDKKKELNSTRYSDRTKRHYSRETHDRYSPGSQERDWDKDRDRTRGKEKERERARRRDRDRVERDGEREITKDRTRERDKERERDQVREGRNKGTNGGREGVRDCGRARSRDKDRDYKVDRLSNRKSYDNNENGYRDRDNNSRRRRNTEDHHRERSRRSDLENASFKSNPPGRDGENLKREDDGQEDYQDKIVMQLADKEEEDLERIKEESRMLKQAILERHKNKSSQQNEMQSEDMVKKQVGQSDEQVASADAAVEIIDSWVDGVENFVSESSFSVGNSPLQNGHLSAFQRPAGAGGLGEGTPKSERSEDMFCDDMFGESPAVVRKTGKGDNVAVERSGLHDNWDDAEGYYGYRFGEILDGRYEIIAAHGKGVFSTVVRAKDLKAKSVDHEEVAIKIIRNNETMYKVGMEELVVLKKLVRADPENKRHCVRFISSFKYRNHLCLVFESLHMNLREVLKKFGRNIGLKLTAVRSYAKQLFMALKHLKNCSVLHCDIKPDNMLVNEAKNVLKLCDFGNAMFAGKNEITPYLVSRFYRAPEIILGLPYDHPMDIWSVGCCLFELYTGKVLFPGPTNNDMLRLPMELKGPFPKKMLRKGAFTDQHFDQDYNFLATEEDPVTKKAIRRLLVNVKPKDFGSLLLGSPGEEPKMLANFKDLMDKIFVLDPEKRLNVSQALSHPFITGK